MLDVCLLGLGGMMPLPGRALSACLLRSGGETMLFDCGEGTQVTWRVAGWPFKPTGTILFSHLHADHILGLPGILFQLAQSDRGEPVTIYGPQGTYEVARYLAALGGWIPFDLRVVELAGDATLELPGGIQLTTIELRHRVPCLGYRLDLARAPRFDPDRARALGVPVAEWKRLQRGETVGDVRPEDVTGPPRRGLRVALITDSSYFPELVPFVEDSDLLLCEAMYAHDADLERAEQRGHMTARQAAGLARAARARRLWLTHLSPSVEDPQTVLDAARTVFPAAELGQPATTETLRFGDAR